MSTTKEIYREGTELRLVTAAGMIFRGPVLNQDGDFLTIKDRRTGRNVSVNLYHIQSVEVIIFENIELTAKKAPPEDDRDAPGRWTQ